MSFEMRRYVGKKVNLLFDDRLDKLDTSDKDKIEDFIIYGGEDRETTWVNGYVTGIDDDNIRLKNATYEGEEETRRRSMMVSTDNLVIIEGPVYDSKKKPKVPDKLNKKGRYKNFIGKRVRILVDRKLVPDDVFDESYTSWVEGIVLGGNKFLQLMYAMHEGETKSSERDIDIHKDRILFIEGKPYNNSQENDT